MFTSKLPLNIFFGPFSRKRKTILFKCVYLIQVYFVNFCSSTLAYRHLRVNRHGLKRFHEVSLTRHHVVITVSCSFLAVWTDWINTFSKHYVLGHCSWSNHSRCKIPILDISEVMVFTPQIWGGTQLTAVWPDQQLKRLTEQEELEPWQLWIHVLLAWPSPQRTLARIQVLSQTQVVADEHTETAPCISFTSERRNPT